MDAARSLWSRILEGDLGHESEKASTIEHLADSYSYVGQDPTTAEQYYRRLLAVHPTLNGTTATAEISLAELLIDNGDSASMEEALTLLNSCLERGTSQFPNVLFRWHLALIRIAQVTGEKETVRRAARTALDLARRDTCRHGNGRVDRYGWLPATRVFVSADGHSTLVEVTFETRVYNAAP
jgi:hypothetical protein